MARASSLGWGALAGLVMVGLRLLLPWPLANVVEPWVNGGQVGSGIETAARGGAMFLGIFVALGMGDYAARVAFARFSVDLVGDLRSQAPKAPDKTRGDHLARMIGDTARLKEGLKGFLIHVVTNGLLCIGLVFMLMTLDVRLAAVFAGGLVVIFVGSLWFTSRVSGRAKRLRKREGRLANVIHEAHGTSKKAKKRAERGPQIKPSRKHPKATLTVLQGQATWAVHCVLALVILGCLAIAGPMGSHPLGHRELIVFLTYMLHIYHPVVRLARQLTRVGKLEACADRIRTAYEGESDPEVTERLAPLVGQVTWKQFSVRAGERGGGGLRLGPVSLVLKKGERVAVVGGVASGKTTLLESLAQRSRAKSSGQLLWDEVELAGLSTKTRKTRVAIRRSLSAATGAGKLSNLDILCIDDALESAAPETLDELFNIAGESLLLVSMRQPVQLERFDRVVRLECGQIEVNA